MFYKKTKGKRTEMFMNNCKNRGVFVEYDIEPYEKKK